MPSCLDEKVFPDLAPQSETSRLDILLTAALSQTSFGSAVSLVKDHEYIKYRRAAVRNRRVFRDGPRYHVHHLRVGACGGSGTL